MWFFIVNPIVGAVLGQATNAWFKKKKKQRWVNGSMAKWNHGTTGRQKDMILKILTAEEKQCKNLLLSRN